MHNESSGYLGCSCTRRGRLETYLAVSTSEEQAMVDAYLDIETTGLSCYWDEITVVGIGVAKGSRIKIVQFFDEELTLQNLVDALGGVSTIYTYNGTRFDLPFIEQYLGGT